MKDYYEILEVNKTASEDTIKKIFRILIKKNHPDLFYGEEKTLAEEKVKLLNEAYEVLINKESREQYDLELEDSILDKSYLQDLIEENEYLKNVIIQKNKIINEYIGEIEEQEELQGNIYDENFNKWNKKEIIRKLVTIFVTVLICATLLWAVTGVNLFAVFIETFKVMF